MSIWRDFSAQLGASTLQAVTEAATARVVGEIRSSGSTIGSDKVARDIKADLSAPVRSFGGTAGNVSTDKILLIGGAVVISVLLIKFLK